MLPSFVLYSLHHVTLICITSICANHSCYLRLSCPLISFTVICVIPIFFTLIYVTFICVILLDLSSSVLCLHLSVSHLSSLICVTLIYVGLICVTFIYVTFSSVTFSWLPHLCTHLLFYTSNFHFCHHHLSYPHLCYNNLRYPIWLTVICATFFFYPHLWSPSFVLSSHLCFLFCVTFIGISFICVIISCVPSFVLPLICVTSLGTMH